MSRTPPPRVVYDCNVFLQALISTSGPSGECVRAAFRGEVILFISEFVINEIRDVTARPIVASRFEITPKRVDLLLANIASVAILIAEVAPVYEHPHDPNDSPYINLALAACAHLVVSRDRHLLNLMDAASPHGRDFQRRFADLKIIDPTTLLHDLRET